MKELSKWRFFLSKSSGYLENSKQILQFDEENVLIEIFEMT